MNNDFYYNLYEKIEKALYQNEITKTAIAKRLGITGTAFSYQLANLKKGKGINIRTLKAVEDMTDVKFFY